jgi:hypothetical protein
VKKRILPLLEIEADDLVCGDECLYLSKGPHYPTCLLFTGELDRDFTKILRADECKQAEQQAKQVTPCP